MIITIDTSKDSRDDIKRAISLLQQIAHGSSESTYGNPPVNSAFDFSTPSSNSVQQNSQSTSDGFAAMFGDMNSSSSQVPVTSSLSQPLSNVAATPANSVSKKKEKYDFETY